MYKHVFRLATIAPVVLTLGSAALPAQTQTSPSAAPDGLTRRQILKQLDPDMAQVVLLFNVINGRPAVKLSQQDARQQFAIQSAAKIIARAGGGAERPTPIGKILDGMTVPGRSGNQIPIRIYYPRTNSNGPYPVIVYYHGGGFVLATINTYDESARTLCRDSGAIVVAVEYRKAPEAPFPAAREDAIDAYSWVVNNISGYNGLSGKVAVAGESAGGNLAAEVAISARDEGLQMPTHQLLIYPETTSNLNQTSDLLYTSPFLPLNTALLKYLDDSYLPSSVDRQDPRVAPINANLKGLPPATIIAAELDPLRSDGEDYAAALKAANVPVVYQLYTGVTHEFFGMGAVVTKASEAEQFAGARLAASF